MEEREHQCFYTLFHDWIASLDHGNTDLKIIPENFKNFEERQARLRAFEATETFHPKKNQTLASLKNELNRKTEPLRKSITIRDEILASYVEELALGAIESATRTRIIVTLGSLHSISERLDPELQQNTSVKKVDCSSNIPVTEDEIMYNLDEMTNSEFARAFLYFGVAGRIKRMFLSIYSDCQLKELGRKDDGSTILHYYYEIVQKLPLKTVYYILQEVLQIDCGVSEAEFSGIEIPYPFSADKEQFWKNLENLTKQYGLISHSNSEIGHFFDRRTIVHFLIYSFEIVDSETAMSVQKFVDALPIKTVKQIKKELIENRKTTLHKALKAHKRKMSRKFKEQISKCAI